MITIEHLANLAISACEAIQAPYMLTGALAYNYYAIPRSTKDVDIVVNITEPGTMARIIDHLKPAIVFSPEIQFDTITWGRKHIFSKALGHEVWIPMAEDLVVQKIRWGR